MFWSFSKQSENSEIQSSSMASSVSGVAAGSWPEWEVSTVEKQWKTAMQREVNTKLSMFDSHSSDIL